MTGVVERLATVLAGRYAVERELGHGGMATVYLAHDLRHNRDVALKILHAELAAAVGSERFLREVQIAAGLTHPHILPLHDSGEADGVPFYVMPYVAGETLRQRLERERQLPIECAVRIACEIAAALDYAHREGIVHRDVKPENVLLEDGQAVVADFGIARAVAEAGSATLTKTGIALGTPAYMSPEQANGERDIDRRSDVYSLGCVLYEMLAGQPPFTGPSAQAVVARHRLDPVPSLRTVRESVPERLEQAIAKALAKVPADRFQSAAEMREALSIAIAGALRTPPAPPGARRRTVLFVATAVLAAIGAGLAVSQDRLDDLLRRRLAALRMSEEPRLAVLPFRNVGPPADEYFADGITDEIVTRLTGFAGMGVIARTSTMQYKGAQKTPKEIAAELGADYVLEGTIRWQRSANGPARVRVTPQLVRASDERQVWAQVYDEAMTEVFTLQSDLAERVASALGVALVRSGDRPAQAAPTSNLDAYDYYLRGLAYYDRGHGAQETRIAEQMFQRAVALDPRFALAHARLAREHVEQYWFAYDRSAARLAKAESAAARALELDPELPEVHIALGFYHYMGRRDYQAALREFALVLRKQPSNSDVLSAMGFVYRRQGKFDLSRAYLEAATGLDPRSARLLVNLAATHDLLRNYDEAHRFCDRAIALAPEWATPYEVKALMHVKETGKTWEARPVLDSALRHVEPFADRSFAIALISLDIYEQQYQRALARLRIAPREVIASQYYFLPKALISAQIFGLMRRRELERAYYDSARTLIEDSLRIRPADDRMRAALGIAYAALGRKQDAIREGRRAVDLMPMTQDAWAGAYRVLDLAHIYTLLGEHGLAVERLAYLLSVPSPVADGLLRVDPRWNPLRGDPGFQRLLERN